VGFSWLKNLAPLGVRFFPAWRVVWPLQDGGITETGPARLTTSGVSQSVARPHKVQPGRGLGIREPSGARTKALLGTVPDADDNPSCRGQGRDHTAHRVAYLPTHVFFIVESKQDGH